MSLPRSPSLRRQSEVPARHATAIGAAVPMAQAAERGDIEAVYRIWEALDGVGKIDVIAALAQLPAWIIELMGGDATEVFAEAARKLTEPEGDQPAGS